MAPKKKKSSRPPKTGILEDSEAPTDPPKTLSSDAPPATDTYSTLKKGTLEEDFEAAGGPEQTDEPLASDAPASRSAFEKAAPESSKDNLALALGITSKRTRRVPHQRRVKCLWRSFPVAADDIASLRLGWILVILDLVIMCLAFFIWIPCFLPITPVAQLVVGVLNLICDVGLDLISRRGRINDVEGKRAPINWILSLRFAAFFIVPTLCVVVDFVSPPTQAPMLRRGKNPAVRKILSSTSTLVLVECDSEKSQKS